MRINSNKEKLNQENLLIKNEENISEDNVTLFVVFD